MEGRTELEALWPKLHNHYLNDTVAGHAQLCDELFEIYQGLAGISDQGSLLMDLQSRLRSWISANDVDTKLHSSMDFDLRYDTVVVEASHQTLHDICFSLACLHLTEGGTQLPMDYENRHRYIPNHKRDRLGNEDDREIANTSPDTMLASPAAKNSFIISWAIPEQMEKLLRLTDRIRKEASFDRLYNITENAGDRIANDSMNNAIAKADAFINLKFDRIPGNLRKVMIQANSVRLRRLLYNREFIRRMNKYFPGSEPLGSHLHGDSQMVPMIPKFNIRRPAAGILPARETSEEPRPQSRRQNELLTVPLLRDSKVCPYCGVMLELEGSCEDLKWKCHLLRDLNPYVCISPGCTDRDEEQKNPLMFSISQSWCDHLSEDHNIVWVCSRHDDEKIFTTEKLFNHHMLHDHDVPEENDKGRSVLYQRPTFKKIAQCPFCTKFEENLQYEEHDTFTNKALFDHAVMHMKEFAVSLLEQVLPPHIVDESSVTNIFAVDAESDGILRLKALALKKPVHSSIFKPLTNKSQNCGAEDTNTVNQPVPDSVLNEGADPPAKIDQLPLREAKPIRNSDSRKRKTPILDNGHSSA